MREAVEISINTEDRATSHSDAHFISPFHFLPFPSHLNCESWQRKGGLLFYSLPFDYLVDAVFPIVPPIFCFWLDDNGVQTRP